MGPSCANAEGDDGDGFDVCANGTDEADGAEGFGNANDGMTW